MYKRKRLYDRRDTYRDTGIPCGNPKRVHTGEVLCMPGVSASAMRSTAAAQATESMKTQGEEQLRVMAQKQLNTKLSMQELSSQHRQFTEAGRYKPVLKEVKGVLRLREYEDIARGDERVATLRQCGLTDDEVRLQLGREGAGKGPAAGGTDKGSYGTHPDVQEDRLHVIDSKIQEKEASLALPDTFRDLKKISRQEMDIEKSLFLGTSRDSGNLTNLLTEKKSDISGDPNDPINQLPQLMADIEERAREKIREKRRRRRRNRKQGNKTGVSDCDVEVPNKDEEDDDEQDGSIIGCLTFEETQALKESEKAVKDNVGKSTNCGSEDLRSSTPASQNSHDGGSDLHTAHTCTKEQASVEESNVPSGASAEGERKVLQGPVEFLPEQYIKENQLTVEQIRQLPKFSSYEAGTPSNVLYVKNLSPRCSEKDLVSLFGRFQKERESHIVYRLMTGRMRGQAFVSFDSAVVATQALQLVNGFLLHGKPVIVQYGRRTTS